MAMCQISNVLTEKHVVYEPQSKFSKLHESQTVLSSKHRLRIERETVKTRTVKRKLRKRRISTGIFFFLKYTIHTQRHNENVSYKNVRNMNTVREDSVSEKLT